MRSERVREGPSDTPGVEICLSSGASSCEEMNSFQLSPDRVLLVGFSAGGSLAAFTALQAPWQIGEPRSCKGKGKKKEREREHKMKERKERGEKRREKEHERTKRMKIKKEKRERRN